MRVGLGKIMDSWLQLLLNIVVFAVFLLVAVLLKPTLMEYSDEVWAGNFVNNVKLGMLIGVVLHIATIIIFAFLEPGNLRTHWWLALVVNVLVGAGMTIVHLYDNYTPEVLLTVVSVAVFMLMYISSYIIATLFMPREIRFANPIAAVLL